MTNSSGVNLDSFSWSAKQMSIRDNTSRTGQIDVWPGHQGDEPGDKDQRLDKIVRNDTEQPKAGPKEGGQDARSDPRCLQLNATRCSVWQLLQPSRRKPC